MTFSKKSLKPLFICCLALIATSCLDNPEPAYVRTSEDEQADLNTFIHALEEQGHDVDTTELGVFYMVVEEGEGDFPVVGDSLAYTYDGYFLNGTLFDSSFYWEDDGITGIHFLEEGYRMIPGFEDGLALMNKGAELQIIIPSSLGYGPYGYSSIPGYAPLLFAVKMVDVIHE